MDSLKVALTTAPALRPLDYSEGAGEIIVIVNASSTSFGVALTQIQMFDFDVRYILGRKNVVADALSRKPNGPVPDKDGDLDDWVDSQLDAVHLHMRPITIQPISNIEAAEGAGATDDGSLLDSIYSERSQQIA
ncbi:hypothetical protein M433DRAFT_9715 [Acidomyces richmondensis BFW]|nr:hypothetical protein M433DRAFT_9715 [Acidomyces richmondensis BFW]